PYNMPVYPGALRIADQPEAIRPNHLKMALLLKICRVKRGCSYLPTGTLRRTSSKKFSRNISWLCAFCPSAVSTGINATMRLTSGARSTFLLLLTLPPICFSDHARGFVGHEGIAIYRIRCHHDVVVQSLEKQLASVARPPRVRAATVRD